MIIIFVGGGDVIVWGKLPSFTGWLTSPYRRVTFPHNLHHVDVYINRNIYINIKSLKIILVRRLSSRTENNIP